MNKESKTLRDLKEEAKGEYLSYAKKEYLSYSKLRAQMIEWVKEDIDLFGVVKIPEITKGWMKRLNITKEDLKEEK